MSLATGSQTDRALDVLEEEKNTIATETREAGELTTTTADPNDAQTPFPTALVLTREKEDELVQFALKYLDDLETQMGRVVMPSIGGQTPVPDETTFFGKRELHTMRYYNNVQDRPYRTAGDSIWKHSNITASLSQRITMQMIARANNFYFGTDPWFAIHFVGTEDKALSERVDRHSKWKFNITALKDTMLLATEFAFVRGEAVVKTIHQVKERYYKKRGGALHDGATGMPVMDGKGNYIFAGAAWVEEMVPDQNALALMQQQAMAAGQPMEPALAPMIPTGRRVLKKDKTIYQPAPGPDGKLIYKEGLWPMKRTVFEGPESRLVYYKDFLCPLDAPDIHEAELIAHLYDLPVMNIIEMFRRQDLATLGAGESLEAMRNAVDAIRQLSGAGTDPKSGDRQNRPGSGEQGNSASEENQLAEVAECYLRYDADGDGIAEEIMIVLDRANRFPLFYDYTDNVCVNGRRPFEVIRGKTIDGRWWGMGSMEYFQPEQEFIDLMVNRKNFRMSAAGRITFWNPNATMEGRANPRLRLNHGGTYTLVDGFKPEDAAGYVTLPEEGADLMDFINFFMQLMQLKSGIINAGDQKASGMPTSETATGVNNVEKSGQEMFAQWLTSLEPGHRGVLLSNIRVLYANLQQPELYRFFDTGANMQASDILTPEDVADLEFDVEILLTRVRTEQVLQMSAEARALVVEFYTTLPPIAQTASAVMYRDSLKALGYNNAEDIIQPLPDPMAMQGGAGLPAIGGVPAGGAASPQGAPAPGAPSAATGAPLPPPGTPRQATAATPPEPAPAASIV